MSQTLAYNGSIPLLGNEITATLAGNIADIEARK